MKTLLRMTALLLLLPAAAAAQWDDGPGGVITLGGGFSVPSGGDLNIIADTGYAISGTVAGPLAGPLAWRADGGYDRMKLTGQLKDECEFAGGNCKDPSVLHVAGGIQLGGLAGSTAPYTYGQLGVYNVDYGLGADSETDFGVAFGTGVNWAVGEGWGIGVEFEITAFWPKDTLTGPSGTQWFSTTTFGAFFRF